MTRQGSSIISKEFYQLKPCKELRQIQTRQGHTLICWGGMTLTNGLIPL